MAINKLNLTFANKKTPPQQNDESINATNLNKITQKIDELIDFSSKMINAGDFNNAIETGFYVMRGGCTNSPLGENANQDSHFYLITIRYTNSNYCIQLSATITIGNMNLYQRKMYNGVWCDWKII